MHVYIVLALNVAVSSTYIITCNPIQGILFATLYTVLHVYFYTIYISHSADGKICHIKVLKLNGMYSLQPIGFKSRVEFKSIEDLVIYHSEHAFAVYDLFATLKYAVNGD